MLLHSGATSGGSDVTEEKLSGFYIYYKTHVKTGSPAHRPPITHPMGLCLIAVKWKGYWMNGCSAQSINKQYDVSVRHADLRARGCRMPPFVMYERVCCYKIGQDFFLLKIQSIHFGLNVDMQNKEVKKRKKDCISCKFYSELYMLISATNSIRRVGKNKKKFHRHSFWNQFSSISEAELCYFRYLIFMLYANARDKDAHIVLWPFLRTHNTYWCVITALIKH